MSNSFWEETVGTKAVSFMKMSPAADILNFSKGKFTFDMLK